jgi:hypothetical protein
MYLTRSYFSAELFDTGVYFFWAVMKIEILLRFASLKRGFGRCYLCKLCRQISCFHPH